MSQIKNISILVDNESWILPWAKRLLAEASLLEFEAVLVRSADEIEEGFACFLLGCIKLVPSKILARNQFNLVVHESALPEGKGFSPMTWQILEGKSEIPVCLIEADEAVDAGVIYYQDEIVLDGHELSSEWREIQGAKTLQLCRRFLERCGSGEYRDLASAVNQTGVGSTYRRRSSKDSELDISLSIEAQMPLLRVVDNDRYPAFFSYQGHKYQLTIEKVE